MSEIIETAAENGDKGRKISESSDTEFDPQFKPIITLPEVQVSTNEENEIELLKLRAKLYRFDSHSDPPEWKERGTGDMKLLRHKENNSVRLVMRRDKTLKVCANHFITPWMELKPSFGNEKAFVYTVFADFADEEAKRECLAIKFGTIDNAKLFKEKFEEAKHIVATECDLYNGKGDELLQQSSDDEGEDDGDDNSKDKSTSDAGTGDVTARLSELNVSKDDSLNADKSPEKDK